MDFKFNKLKSKKGTSLVEVIASVFILAIVVSGVVLTMNFSQRVILSKSSQNKAAAQAQSIADILMDKVKSQDIDEIKSDKIDGASYVKNEKFPSERKNKQFTIYNVKNIKNKIEGYKIKTAVYYNDGNGKKCVKMTAFAAKE